MSMIGRFAVAAAAGAILGFVLGRGIGPSPVVFPEVDAGRTDAEMYDAVLAALHEPRSFVRASTLTRLFEGLTAANIEGARRAIRERAGLGDPIDLQIFVAAWVELDALSAVEAVQGWNLEVRRRIAFTAAIREWAAGGRGIAAGNYLQTVEDPGLRRASLGPLVRGWALSGDFQGAIGLAQRLFHEQDVDVVDGFVRGMLQVSGAGQVLDVARQVAEQGDGPFEQRLIAVALNLAGREDPAGAAGLVDDVFEGDVPVWLRPTLPDLAILYGDEDPSAGLAWLLGLGASAERDGAIEESALRWSRLDYEAAWAWFETTRGPFAEGPLPHEDSLLMTGLLRKTARVQPERASRWIPRIADAGARSMMNKRLAYFWGRQDPSSAAAWIDGLALPADRAEELRDAASRGRQSVDVDPTAGPLLEGRSER